MVDLKEVDRIIDSYGDEPGILVQVMEDVQNLYHWLPEEALQQVCERLKVPLSQAYSAATFYKAFSLKPKGRHIACVCLGTACHVRGGPKILDKAEQVLGIREGETTADMRYTLERVNCLGCCALGPVIVIDGEAHGNLVPAKVGEVLSKYD
jgi:NADH-quinone oxidoreductase subunit E